MATIITVRDLRYDFPRVEALLQQGEEIQITKRGKFLAYLSPRKPAYRPLPDFIGRMKEIYGDRIVEPTGAEIIAMDRDRL